MMHRQLFEGPNIRLAPVDPEKDAAAEAAWTYDLDYAQTLRWGQARPLATFELKKYYEGVQKKTEDKGSVFLFAIRLKEEDRLIGFVRIPWVFWSHASAVFQISIGEAEMQAQFGAEALDLLLNYGFRELNLYRMETALAAYRAEMISLIEQAGFLMEIRRRQTIFRDGRHWDTLYYGLLHSEWDSKEKEALAL
jgi:RimJ/RimL family protein N-acetyltransferase